MLVLLVLLASAPESPPPADASWGNQEQREGMTLETREVPGSDHQEIRVTLDAQAKVADKMCAAVWGGDRWPLEPDFKEREILSETKTERWVYERVAAAPITDRDYVMHWRRAPTKQPGCKLVFETDNTKGPEPKPDAVRIKTCRGSWEVTPLPEGGSHVVYKVFAEPGGKVPAWLSKTGARDNAFKWVKTIVERSTKEPAPTSAKR